MTSMPLKASLIVLALFMVAGPGLSAGTTQPRNTVVAQAEEDTGDSSQRIDAVRKFLAGGKNLSQLDDDRLQKRLKRAQRMQRIPDLPADLSSGLQQEMAEISSELSRRSSGAPQATEAQGTSANQAAENDNSAPDASASPNDVAGFLQSVRPASELESKELRSQMRRATQLMKADGVSRSDRQQLRQVVRDARAEMQKRKGGNDSADAAGADGDSEDGGNQSVQNAEKTNELVPSDRDQEADGQGSASNAEQQARALLDSQVDPRNLEKGELRKRLASMRQLLATGKLSPETNKALRQRLANERTVLRAEVSRDTDSEQATSNNNTSDQDATINGDNNSVVNNNVTVNNTTNIINNKEVVKVVVGDRRPSRNLRDDELRRRINVYRVVAFDNSYPESERAKLRIILDQDRVVLRERLLVERRKREVDLRSRVKSGNLDVDVSVNFDPARRPPRSVFAAEVNDREIEDTLAAPPRRKIDRRYTVDEVESNPDLRDAVARIEIDTVHFGFGEGFLREEEVGNLDRIAEIMEKILAASPGEIFMIEGHTDAVGSDAANLELSKERARAVKEALATYYVIPEENLKTVGFGERYLKIPTQDPEAENRRVSIARITPLVGALGK
jgi:outer membrane protein OmpA-like peptidoglycan-associated protein